MDTHLNEVGYKEEKTLYNFHSAKKIYLACTPSKYVLLEKKEKVFFVKTVSLKNRNTVVINRNGMLVFPDTRS